MTGLRRRLDRVEEHARPDPDAERLREEERERNRELAEQENERYFRHLAIERRTHFLESVGYEGHSAGDLRDENFLYTDDEPPFTIAEDGVFATRDGKPITDAHQTLAVLRYWEFRDEGYNPRGLIHDEERQAYFLPDPPHELAFSRDRWYLPRYFWALGDERADPYCIHTPGRLVGGG